MRQLTIPIPKQPERTRETLPLEGRYSADIPPYERAFLDGLRKGSQVVVTWGTAKKEDAGLAVFRQYRCDAVVARSTAASLWVGEMRFARKTGFGIGSDQAERTRITSPAYPFFGELHPATQYDLKLWVGEELER